MAILQVRDMDETTYRQLRERARRDHRSLSQEVIGIIENWLTQPGPEAATRTREFLNLTWHGRESAETLLKELRSSRKNSRRFGARHDVFD